MLLQMGPFHALKGKVEHNDEKTDVANARWDEIILELRTNNRDYRSSIVDIDDCSSVP